MRWLLIFLLFTERLVSQKDSLAGIGVPLVGIHIGGQIPLADMSKRFGANLNAGGSFMYKTTRNFLWGADAGYLFGQNVREDVLSQLRTPEGFVVDNEGYPADLRVTERGIIVSAVFGKIFRLASANPNSGLMVTAGAGFMQHKVKLFDAQARVAAIKGELAYGYDRLTMGASLSQFIGYLFLSDNRMLNFYFGMEIHEGFTTSVRKLNYDTGLPDTNKRLDVLTGFRFGWILPLYKKKPNEFYFY